VGAREAEILYLSSALNTGSENVYEVKKKWPLFGTPPLYND